jgi:hypothetical protein
MAPTGLNLRARHGAVATVLRPPTRSGSAPHRVSGNRHHIADGQLRNHRFISGLHSSSFSGAVAGGFLGNPHGRGAVIVAARVPAATIAAELKITGPAKCLMSPPLAQTLFGTAPPWARQVPPEAHTCQWTSAFSGVYFRNYDVSISCDRMLRSNQAFHHFEWRMSWLILACTGVFSQQQFF